jgi:hypothetical protein
MLLNALFNIRNENFLTISLGDLKVFCEYTKSQNGQHIVAFCDGDPLRHVGGHRKSGKGFYFLISNNNLKLYGQLERLNDGKVANNSFFVVNDWLFDDRTISIGYCFNQNGEIVIKKRFKANLLTNAISPSGGFALFKTCNSNNSDSDCLFLYDASNGTLLWKKKFGFKNPVLITIDDEKKIMLHYKDTCGIILDSQARQIGYFSS